MLMILTRIKLATNHLRKENVKHFLSRVCRTASVGLTVLVGSVSYAQSQKTEHVFLITLDGLRWQELFTGADPQLIAHPEYVEDSTELKELFWRSDAADRREALLPFFSTVLASRGQLYGNRLRGSRVNLTNDFWFSYPGYNEILTGYGDERIDSNDKRPNPNRTVLEYLNEQNDFAGQVAAFGSWDVFPYIINEERSGIPVNAGYELAEGPDLSTLEATLNTLQPQIPGHWPTVRMDAFTHHYALEHLRAHPSRVVYVAYGETDDFAHDGRYDAYLKAAHRTDTFIHQLWKFAQSHPQYRDKTTLVITTDHGRGTEPLDTWRSHGADVDGSDQVWIAIIGPDTPANVSTEGQFFTNQIAPTVSAMLEVAYDPPHEVGEVIKAALE